MDFHGILIPQDKYIIEIEFEISRLRKAVYRVHWRPMNKTHSFYRFGESVDYVAIAETQSQKPVTSPAADYLDDGTNRLPQVMFMNDRRHGHPVHGCLFLACTVARIVVLPAVSFFSL